MGSGSVAFLLQLILYQILQIAKLRESSGCGKFPLVYKIEFYTSIYDFQNKRTSRRYYWAKFKSKDSALQLNKLQREWNF